MSIAAVSCVPAILLAVPQADEAAPTSSTVRESTLVVPGSPGKTVTPDHRPTVAASSAAIAVLLIVLACLIWRRANPRSPGDVAFIRLARSMRLSRHEREAVARLAAAHGQAAPVALLLSEHAFRDAVSRARSPRAGASTAVESAKAASSDATLLVLLRRVHGASASS